VDVCVWLIYFQAPLKALLWNSFMAISRLFLVCEPHIWLYLPSSALLIFCRTNCCHCSYYFYYYYCSCCYLNIIVDTSSPTWLSHILLASFVYLPAFTIELMLAQGNATFCLSSHGIFFINLILHLNKTYIIK